MSTPSANRFRALLSRVKWLKKDQKNYSYKPIETDEIKVPPGLHPKFVDGYIRTMREYNIHTRDDGWPEYMKTPFDRVTYRMCWAFSFILFAIGMQKPVHDFLNK